MKILAMGNLLIERLTPEQQLQIPGQYRAGDIRHCYAGISKINQRLEYAPQVTFEDGMNELIEWVGTQQADDRVEIAKAQLLERSLVQ